MYVHKGGPLIRKAGNLQIPRKLLALKKFYSLFKANPNDDLNYIPSKGSMHSSEI